MPMTKITRTEDRATGAVCYWLDDGGPQIAGPSYDTREQAEAALAARTLGRRGGLAGTEAQREARSQTGREHGSRAGRPRVDRAAITAAADEYVSGWDTPDAVSNTARLGLAETDREALRAAYPAGMARSVGAAIVRICRARHAA